MCDRGEPLSRGEGGNNNQHRVRSRDSNGDANANDIQKDSRTRTGDRSKLMGSNTEQDKVDIWDRDTQCDDPELAEFEMLECQELEEVEDFVGLTERKECRHQLGSKSNTAAQATSNKDEKPNAHSSEESSETDVFMLCMSTIPAIDTTDKTTEPWQVPCGPHSTISEDVTSVSLSEKAKTSRNTPGTSTMHPKDVDMNLNMTFHSEAQVSNGEIQCLEQIKEEYRTNNNQKFKDQCVGEKTCEHKLQTNATNTCNGNNIKMDKSTQADESPAAQQFSPATTGIRRSQSSLEPKAMSKQGTFNGSLRKQNSFSHDRSYQKQPSLENSVKKQLSFDNSIKRQGSFENTAASSLSSLERRRPWGSPSRNVMPNSTRTTSCSPRRRLPNSPAKVQSIQAPSLERSKTPLGQTKLSKTCPNTGIPEPLQKEQEPKKNVRPKIITYVRKNSQAKPDLPSTYGVQPKATPVLNSSNILFDKYRQEIQKTGFYPPGMAMTRTKATTGTTTNRLGSKSGSFHEDMSEKYSQEVRKRPLKLTSKMYTVPSKSKM